MKNKNLLTAGLILGSVIMVQQTSAQFQLFEDFNSLTTGDLTGQNGWSGTSSLTVTNGVAFGSGNYAQFNSISVANNATYKPLGSLAIPNSSTVATVFMQFYLPSLVSGANSVSMNLNIDGDSNPVSSGNDPATKVEFNYDSNTSGTVANPFRIRIGTSFAAASTSSGGTAY